MGSTSLRRPAGLSDREFFEREFPTTLGERGRIVACATQRVVGGGEWHRVFYAAVRNTDDAPHAPGQTWALVVLMHWQRGRNVHFNFTYKDLSDESGPGEDEAPAAVLDALSPTDHEYALDWRKRCRANLAWAAAQPRAKRGDVVVFLHPLRFGNGETLTDLVLVERSTFTRPGTSFRYRVPNWRRRVYTVRAA